MNNNLLNIDPTRSTFLRNSFLAGLRKQFRIIKRDLFRLIVKEDAFGLKPTPFDELMTQNRRWAYSNKEEAISNFDRWLADRINRTVSSKAEAERWRKYIERGFEKGVNRAYADTRGLRKGVASEAIQESQREQFLRLSLGTASASEKLRLLRFKALRNVEDMAGEMKSRARRVLTDGLVKGLSPREIATGLSKALDISQARALTIARTELVTAHAEGQLEAMEQLGITEVGVAVEWSVKAGACKLCTPLKGIVLKVSEARGMIPRHPNCYCAWVPANLGESKEEKKQQKRTQPSIKRAIKKSEKEEGGDSDWGPNRAISKKRPESVLTKNEEHQDCTCHPGLLRFAELLEAIEQKPVEGG